MAHDTVSHLLYGSSGVPGEGIPLEHSSSIPQWIQYKQEQQDQAKQEELWGCIVQEWTVRKPTHRHDGRYVERRPPRTTQPPEQSPEEGVVTRSLAWTTQGYLLERDPAGGRMELVSCRHVSELVALVRPPINNINTNEDDPQVREEVVLEFGHGHPTVYQSMASTRDALVVSLLDAIQSTTTTSDDPVSVLLLDHATTGYALTWLGGPVTTEPYHATLGGHNPNNNTTAASLALKRIYALSTQAHAYVSHVYQDLQSLVRSPTTTATTATNGPAARDAKNPSIVSETTVLQRACREFNVTVPMALTPNARRTGPWDSIRDNEDDPKTSQWIRGTLGALAGLVAHLLRESTTHHTTSSNPAYSVAGTLLQTMVRLVQTPVGYRTVVELDTFGVWLDACGSTLWAPLPLSSSQQPQRQQRLSSQAVFCQYWAWTLIQTLVSARGASSSSATTSTTTPTTTTTKSRDMEAEYVNKNVILTRGGTALQQALVSSLFGSTTTNNDTNHHYHYPHSELIVLVTSDILQSVLCTSSDTTSPTHFRVLLQAVAQHYPSLLTALRRCTTPVVLENVALLLHLISTHAPATAQAIRNAALSSGTLLHHFQAALFSPQEGQRFLSRFVCSLWLSGPLDCPEKRLLQRMVPQGFLPYLNMPGLSKMEQDQLDAMERDVFAGTTTTTTTTTSSQRLPGGANAARLRARIRRASAAAVAPPTTSTSSQQQQQQPSPESSRHQFHHAPQTTPRLENFRIFFHVLTQDHSLADLIWSQQTRQELRAALEHEIQYIERQQEARGAQNVAWNHQQFKVDYPSLDHEVKVGSVYMRLWLQAGDGFIQSWQDPVRLLELLFRRFLCELDRNQTVAVMCIQCLERLYAIHSARIGPFSDMMILVHSMAATKSIETQHRLLQFLATLLGVSSSHDQDGRAVAEIPENAEQLLTAQSIGQLCQFVAWGHSHGLPLDQQNRRGVSLIATQTETKRLLGSTSENTKTTEVKDAATETTPTASDVACPAVWYTASTGRVPPPAEFVRGPYRVSELAKLMDEGELSPYDLVASSLVQDYDSTGTDGVREEHMDTGKWKRLNELWQLRWQLCTDGTRSGIYAPAEVALLALQSLNRLVDLHKSLDAAGVPYVPIPAAKRILTDRNRAVEVNNSAGARPFSILSQGLLCNDSRVVEQSARLLHNLLQYNPDATSKFYLTGAFFFILSYAGSNFSALAQLLQATHLHQNFRSGSEATAKGKELPMKDRSVLGTMLPEGLVYVLDNYGYQRFVDVFLGNADTPEVIWTMEMRTHLIEMIRQHLGDFPFRLYQNNTLEYEYCPIPAISYKRLQPELFCHNYYLHNLCDEERFPDWPIAEPMEVLRSCLQEFQHKKGESDDSSSDTLEKARRLLELQEGDSGKELRRAYRTQARLYHPDKNPGGREMFEAIQKAYEVLLPIVESGEKIQSYSSESESGYHDTSGATEGFAGGLSRMNLMHLLIRAQLLIYRRFEGTVAEVKYPSYDVLLECIKLPDSCINFANDRDKEGLLASCFVREERAEMIRHGVELVYRTCLVSPLNAEELVSRGGVPILAQLLRVTTRTLDALTDCGESAGRSRASLLSTTEHIVRTLGGVAFYENGRETIASLTDVTGFLMDWKQCVNGNVVNASRVEDNSVRLFALEGIMNLSKLESLQTGMVNCGVCWPLLKLLLRFDPTVEASQGGDEKTDFSMHSMNLLANTAVRALGALSGLLTSFGRNGFLLEALDKLLTAPMAKLLRNQRTEETLRLFNTNVEEPYLIWNSAMRKELEFVVGELEGSSSSNGLHDLEQDLARVRSFRFKSLQDEFVIGGVYVRVFLVKGKEALAKIENVLFFAESLLAFLANSLNESGLLSSWGKIPLDSIDRRIYDAVAGINVEVPGPEFSMSLNAVRILVKLLTDDYLMDSALFASTSLALLELPMESEAFDVCCDLLSIVSPKKSFADVIVQEGVLWRVMLVLQRPQNAEDSTDEGQSALESSKRHIRAWSVLEALSSSPSVAQQMIRSTGWLELLGVLVGYGSFSKAWTSRLGAAKTLSRLLWDPSTATTALPLLQRFLPLSLVVLLKEEPEAMLKSFDDESDSPELIWDSSMRAELRGVVAGELDVCIADREKGGSDYSKEFVLDPGVYVKYSKLEDELYLGGVYVSRFLKDPTYSLRDPIGFLEALLQRWVKELHMHTDFQGGDGHPEASALTKSKESVLQVTTTAVVFVCKVKESRCDKLAEWGYIPRVIASLDRVLKRELYGTPLVSIIRVLHVAADRVGNVDAIASVTDHNRTSGIVDSIIRAIGKESLHPDSSFMVETLLKTYKIALGDLSQVAFGGIPGPLAMMPSPASGDEPVIRSVAFSSFGVAMAPSPAPGEGPVQRNRERVSLGDDPLAMFGGSPFPDHGQPRSVQSAANTAPQPQHATMNPGFSPINQQNPLQPHLQSPLANHSPAQYLQATPNWNTINTGSTAHPDLGQRTTVSPGNLSTRNQVERSFATNNPLQPLQQTSTDPLGAHQASHVQPTIPISQPIQPANTGASSYGTSATVAPKFSPSQFHASPKQPYSHVPPREPQYQSNSTTTSSNSHPRIATMSNTFISPQGQSLQSSSALSPQPTHTNPLFESAVNSVRSVEHSHPPDTYPQRNSDSMETEQSTTVRESIFTAHEPDVNPSIGSFGMGSSLGASSFNQPPSTMLNKTAQPEIVNSAASHNLSRFNDDDDEYDDSTEFSPPMTLFGASPLPKDTSSSLFLRDHSTPQLSVPSSHVINQTSSYQSHLPSDVEQKSHLSTNQYDHGHPASHRGAEEYENEPSRPLSESSESTMGITHGSGVDARSPTDPTITANVQAASIGGAPGAAAGRTVLLEQALACNLCEFLVNQFLEHARFDEIRDPAAAKVHAISLLKLLCQDPGYGAKFQLVLGELPAWKKYDRQDHSLLIAASASSTGDYFLTDGGASDTKLLTQG